MLNIIIFLILILLFGYIGLAVGYQIFFAIIYFLYQEKRVDDTGKINRYAIIIPAHNEELVISDLCINLSKIKYESNKYDIFVIADNCDDNTAQICRKNGLKVYERKDSKYMGKGYAIKYAFDILHLNSYEAVLIIDADTHIDRNVLNELNLLLNNGHVAIQCYIEIPNKNETWFTELLDVARVMNGILFHYPKFVCGLSSYLMGSGICFSTELIKKKGWTAFSIAEDWEYYAQLLLEGYRIAFAKNALVYQYESRSLEQATSQRLRWSSGRWQVSKTLGIKLFFEGLKKRDMVLFDSSLPLIFPNFSLQFNLTLGGSFLSLFVFSSMPILFILFSALLACQILLFIAGSFIAGSPLRIFRAAFFAPFFLVWKMVIDLLCFSGLYQGKKWVRTKRHLPRKKNE